MKTGNGIEMLRFWCHKILPLVYDDSLSYYEVLCKVVAKLNEIGEVVNEISNIRDMVDKQLYSVVDELLKEMIANGEFEGIVDETLLNTKVNRYKAKFGVVGGITPQDLIVVKLFDKNLLIDCGNVGDTTQFSNVCRELGVDKIHYVYISHYHEDHAGNFENIASVIDISGATVYCPVMPNIDYAGQLVLEHYNLVMRVCQNNGCNVVHPDEDVEYPLTVMEKIKFYNTDSTPYENDLYKYNNCSMCAALDICGTIAWFDGDLEKDGQIVLTQKNIPCNVMVKKMSHHGTTPAGYEPYFDKLNPQYVIATNGNGVSGDGTHPNYLSAWGYETTIYDRYNVPTFATSNGKQYVIYFDVGERYFGCYSPRYMYRRISPYNTSLAFISEGYSDVAKELTMEDIIEKMPNSYLEFHAPGDWASCPAPYTNGVHWRIWKNNSKNTQDGYGYDSNSHFALAIMTEQSGGVYSEDTNLVMYYKGTQTSGKWKCSVTSLTGTNYILVNRDNVRPSDGETNVSVREGYKGNDFAIEEGKLVCKNDGLYKVTINGGIFGSAGNTYGLRLIINRGGTKTNIQVCGGVKAIDGGNERYNNVYPVFLYRGDIISVASSGSVTSVSCRMFIENVSYTNNVDNVQFLNS